MNKYLLLLLLYLGLNSTTSSAQNVYLMVGTPLQNTTNELQEESNIPIITIGIRTPSFWHISSALEAQFDPIGLHLTAHLQASPGTLFRIEPFIRAGYGFLPGGGNGRTRTVPIGGGLIFHLHPGIQVMGAVEYTRRMNNENIVMDRFWLPKVGINFNVQQLTQTLWADQNTQDTLLKEETFLSDTYALSLEPLADDSSRTDTLTTSTEESARSVTEDMVYIHDGMFIMGLTDEDPLMLQVAGLKRVTLSAYYIDKYEVSNEAYRAFLEGLDAEERARMLPDSTVWQSLGNRYGWTDYFWGAQYSKYPVVGVTWEQAKAFCESQGKRLPTEAEWEYAARGGKIGLVYPWEGLEPRDKQGRYLANYKPGPGAYAADGFAFTAPVFAFPQNEWGLHNIAGNVAEWTMDAYTPTYSVLSDFNPVYEDENEPRRVVRGGSWASDAFYIGVGVRDAMPYNTASPYVGIRCAMDADDPGHDVQVPTCK